MKIFMNKYYKKNFFIELDEKENNFKYGLEIRPKDNYVIQNGVYSKSFEEKYEEIQFYQMAFSDEYKDLLDEINKMIEARKIIAKEKAKVFNKKISSTDFFMFMIQKEILQMKKELEEIL